MEQCIVVGSRNNLRLSDLLEVSSQPNGGIGTKPKLMNDLVPLVVDFSKMHQVVPSGLVSIRTFHLRASKVKVERRKGFHLDSGMVSVVVRSKGRHNSSRRVSGEI